MTDFRVEVMNEDNTRVYAEYQSVIESRWPIVIRVDMRYHIHVTAWKMIVTPVKMIQKVVCFNIDMTFLPL